MTKFDLDSVSKDKIVEYCTNSWFIPVAVEMLNNDSVKTVCVAIAQYYNDEADDAVHVGFYPSSSEFTSWRDFFDAKLNKFVEREAGEDYHYLDKYNRVYDQAMDVVFSDKRKHDPYPDNNEDFIEAFQKYCNFTYDDMDTLEQYTPFLILSKNEDGSVNIRNIGETIRLLK